MQPTLDAVLALMLPYAPQKGIAVDEVSSFVQRWGLQEDSIPLLRGLQPEILSRVMREFRPNEETMNVEGRFRAFVRSVSASVLQVDPIIQFAQKWSLDEDSVQFLRKLPLDVLQRVLTGFTPHADTTNMGGRLRAFAKSVMLAAQGLPFKDIDMPRIGIEAREALVAFAVTWDLDEDSLLLLQQLPLNVLESVLATFSPLGDAETVNHQLQAFAVTKLAELSSVIAPASIPQQLLEVPASNALACACGVARHTYNLVGEPCTRWPAKDQAPLVQVAPRTVPEFLRRWGLGADAEAFLEGLPAETLRVVLTDFRPAEDTKNVLGRLMGFARNIGKATPSHPKGPAAIPAQGGNLGQVPSDLETFATTWGLDEDTIRFLQSLPADVLHRVIQGFTPNQDTKNITGRLRAFVRSMLQPAAAPTVDPTQQFVETWGLDAGTVAFLQGLPQDVRAKVLVGFRPNCDTVNLPGRLRAFARGVLARASGMGGQHAGPIGEFATRWGLSSASVALLGALPAETLRKVLSEFQPPGDTFNIDGRLQSFVRSVAGAGAAKRAAEPVVPAFPAKRQRA